MDPVSAFGVAAAVFGTIDFATKLVSRTHRVFNGEDAEEAAKLESVVRKLEAITEDLNPNWIDKTIFMRGVPNNKMSEELKAYKMLELLREECEGISRRLLGVTLRIEGVEDRSKWDSFRDGLAELWGGEKEVKKLEDDLRKTRAQLDTALLVCLRTEVNALSKNREVEMKDLRKLKEDFEAWQRDLLLEVQKQNWDPMIRREVTSFSSHFNSAMRRRKQDGFGGMMLNRLDFGDLLTRRESIADAHRKTFNWIFKEPSETQSRWADFPSWLSAGDRNTTTDNIYWVTGKPGSGKSTLMKFISLDERTLNLGKLWAGDDQFVMASFYFWNAGSRLQMTGAGLLQSLLYQILAKQRDLIPKIFSERWEQYDSHGGGFRSWTYPELKGAFQRLLSQEGVSFLLIIDGLDEFDGDHQSLVDIITTSTRLPNVKICTASRPWLVFEDAFKVRPNLLMEHLTVDDIRLYISEKFNTNEHYRRIHDQQPQYAEALLEKVAEKSSGVFLWVYLAVDSLLTGLRNSDRLTDLQRRLDDIPAELENLFRKLISGLDPFYWAHACQFIQVLEGALQEGRTLTLLQLSAADDEDIMSAMHTDICPLDENHILDREETMRRRLNSRCRGLLEVQQAQPRSIVTYLHRTARDYVRRRDVWESIESAPDSSFDPALALSNSALFTMKTTSRDIIEFEWFWKRVLDCLVYGGRVKLDENDFLIPYFDEMDRTAKYLTGSNAARWLSRSGVGRSTFDR